MHATTCQCDGPTSRTTRSKKGSVITGRAPATRRTLQPPKAFRLLDLPIFSSILSRGKPPSAARKTRDALLHLLVPAPAAAATGDDGQVEQAGAARQQVDDLIDELAAMQQAFKEQDLSGGPGVVLYTRGTVALWDAVQRLFRGRARRNALRASQALDASTRTLVSKAEFWGPNVYVTASGRYTPQVEGGGTRLQCPVSVDVEVSQGALHLGSTTIPLPIRGTGQFEVVYCDDVLRVFRSGSTYSVQVKESYLDARLQDRQ